MVAYSHPMTPAPTMHREGGKWVICRIESESWIRFAIKGNIGGVVGIGACGDDDVIALDLLILLL